MNRKLILTPESRADIADAIVFLRERSPQLPSRFRERLEYVYSMILEYPEIYPVVYRNFRRGLLRRFPYSVFYVVVDEETILITGVIPNARDASVWKRRAR